MYISRDEKEMEGLKTRTVFRPPSVKFGLDYRADRIVHGNRTADRMGRTLGLLCVCWWVIYHIYTEGSELDALLKLQKRNVVMIH